MENPSDANLRALLRCTFRRFGRWFSVIFSYENTVLIVKDDEEIDADTLVGTHSAKERRLRNFKSENVVVGGKFR